MSVATEIQQAAATYLLDRAGYTAYPHWLPGQKPVAAAAKRIGALGPEWLRDHVGAIRNGNLTLRDIP